MPSELEAVWAKGWGRRAFISIGFKTVKNKSAARCSTLITTKNKISHEN